MSGYLRVPFARGTLDVPPIDRQSVPILVVDDDEMKRYALERLLGSLGYSIVAASSGRAALRCALTQDFALILLDVRMPGMDGFETAAMLRTRRRSELTPILLSTASTKAELLDYGRYGDAVNRFVLAPVDPDELRLVVTMFGNLFLKEQERAAQADEVELGADRWRLLTEAAPVGIFRTDSLHRYTHTNPRWSELTGIPAESALGREWTAIVDATQAACLLAELAGEAPGSAEFSRQIEILTPGGDPKIVLLIVRPTPDGDGEVGDWVGTLTDVTAIASAQAPLRCPCGDVRH